VAGEDESPFARIPTPGIHETPSPMTPMGEVAAYGTMARGVQGRSRIAGRIVGLLFLLLIVGGLLFGTVGWFLLDDDPGPGSDTPPPSLGIVTVPSSVPAVPPSTIAPPPSG
jgi:hypothetical protein